MPSTETFQGTILLSDSNHATRESLIQLLRVHCYRTVVVSNHQQALAEISSHPVDLALVDISMSEKIGFSICKAVKALPETRTIPVVLITADSDDDFIEGFAARADDFLTKPVGKIELLARLRSLVQIKRMKDELANAETVMYALARSIEQRDPFAEGHGERTWRYTELLGKTLGLSEEQLVALHRGSILHDVGKISVPESIMNHGPLDAEERKSIEGHTIVGERICAPLKSFHSILPIIRSHHEKQNGTGYPDQLKRQEIPLLVRILQTADVYDSLTTDQLHRRALTPEKAFEIMWEETRRGWWDATLVDALQGLLLDTPAEMPVSVA